MVAVKNTNSCPEDKCATCDKRDDCDIDKLRKGAEDGLKFLKSMLGDSHPDVKDLVKKMEDVKNEISTRQTFISQCHAIMDKYSDTGDDSMFAVVIQDVGLLWPSMESSVVGAVSVVKALGFSHHELRKVADTEMAKEFIRELGEVIPENVSWAVIGQIDGCAYPLFHWSGSLAIVVGLLEEKVHKALKSSQGVVNEGACE